MERYLLLKYPRDYMNNPLTKLITSGLAYLQDEQLSDGHFPSAPCTMEGKRALQTLFPTVLIGTALSTLTRYESAENIIENISNFLHMHRREDGSWNYCIASKEDTSPYPSDMDDTALAYICLIAHDALYVDAAIMAELVRLLTAVEVREGGPYNTWITDFVADKEWANVDIAVNANIAHLLSLLDVELPEMTSYFDDCIVHNAVFSRHYDSPLQILYFLSRTYKGAYKQACIDLILHEQVNGHWKTPLKTALALCALHRFGVSLGEYGGAIDYLIETAVENHWENEPFSMDPTGASPHFSQGSAALTTALCIEALSYIAHTGEPARFSIMPFLFERDAIITAYRHHTQSLSPEFSLLAERALNDLLADPLLRESMILPYLFARAQGTHVISDHTLHQLGLANLYGWIGYTTLDTIMDNELDKHALPFSVYCIRQAVSIYRALLPGALYESVETILNQIDIAYAHEYRSRLILTDQGIKLDALVPRHTIPTYQKSLGHALPVLAILLLEGHRPEGDTLLRAQTFFEQYLHIRQYSDDAHDLIEDLTAGQLTHVLYDVLTAYKAAYPDATTVNPKKDETTLLELFWHIVFPSVYEAMLQSAQAAKQALADMQLHDPSYFIQLIDELVMQQERMFEERTRMYQFLAAY